MKKLIALTVVIAVLVCSMTVAFADGRMLGDTNNNGQIDILDATSIQLALAQIQGLDEESIRCSDVDGDLRLTIVDCTTIQQLIAELIPDFPANIKPTQPTEPETQEPTQPEELTPSEMELEVLRIVNEERAKIGAAPLEFGYHFYECAIVRANECKELFSHTRPDGTLCFTVFDQFNVTGYYVAGENIAYNHTSAQEVMDAWMNSPGHRANILEPSFTHLAIAMVETGEYPGYYSSVQLFIGQ